MALGIACAGTGNKEAHGLIEPMKNDPTNYVRQVITIFLWSSTFQAFFSSEKLGEKFNKKYCLQGALIASAMILVQQTEQTCPKVKDFRALYQKVITDKHEDVMAKFGAILATSFWENKKKPEKWCVFTFFSFFSASWLIIV